MKLSILIFMSAMFLMSCSSDPRGLTLIENYDKKTSLVRDKNSKLYFQSSAIEQCGSEYWYTNLVTFNDGKNEATYELEQKPLEDIVDLETFKLDKIKRHVYYFQDKANTYTVYTTMCDNVAAYMKKSAPKASKLELK